MRKNFDPDPTTTSDGTPTIQNHLQNQVLEACDIVDHSGMKIPDGQVAVMIIDSFTGEMDVRSEKFLGPPEYYDVSIN